MNALIVGCGDVGTRLGLAWARDGVEVHGVRRRAGSVPAPILAVSGDARDRDTYRALPGRFDFVVYAAAAGAPGDEDAYRAAYVDGPRVMLEHIASWPEEPRSIVFASSTAVYAQVDGSRVDEDSPTEPQDFRGRLLLEGERLVRQASPNARVLRLGGIYGPGRTQLIEGVRSGRIGLSADGSSPWTNRIHVEDAARLLRFVSELPAGAPQLMVGVDREPARRDDVVRWLAARLGVEPAAAASGASRARGGDKRCSSDRVAALGFSFRYPDFRAGYGALLDGGGDSSGD